MFINHLHAMITCQLPAQGVSRQQRPLLMAGHANPPLSRLYVADKVQHASHVHQQVI